MRTFYITLFFLSLVGMCKAQSPEEDAMCFLTKVQEVYTNAAAFDMRIVLAQIGSDNQKITQNYRSVKHGSEFYIETPVLSTIINKDYTLLIDKLQKQVQLSNSNEQPSEIPVISNMIPDLKELRNQIIEVKETPAEFQISLKDPTGFYDEVYYAFAKANYQLRSVRYLKSNTENGEVSEVNLKYSENHIHNEVDTSFFNITPFVKKIESGWVLTDAYKEYSLTNSLVP